MSQVTLEEAVRDYVQAGYRVITRSDYDQALRDHRDGFPVKVIAYSHGPIHDTVYFADDSARFLSYRQRRIAELRDELFYLTHTELDAYPAGGHTAELPIHQQGGLTWWTNPQ